MRGALAFQRRLSRVQTDCLAQRTPGAAPCGRVSRYGAGAEVVCLWAGVFCGGCCAWPGGAPPGSYSWAAGLLRRFSVRVPVLLPPFFPRTRRGASFPSSRLIGRSLSRGGRLLERGAFRHLHVRAPFLPADPEILAYASGSRRCRPFGVLVPPAPRCLWCMLKGGKTACERLGTCLESLTWEAAE